MSAYFVTATGTDIGKTFVTSGLIRYLRLSGRRVNALKPVLSGFDIATAALSDAGQLLEALDEPITPETLDRISPWRFAAPLSPDMAASRENRAIDFDQLVQTCRELLKDDGAISFVEGVGGVMVPLDVEHTVLDWMKEFGLPVILVAGSYLGTISHTLSALEVLRSNELLVKAVVVNDTPSDIPLTETAMVIGRFAPGIPICTFPRVKHWHGAKEAIARLWSAIA